jgi:hypothetical protein
MPCSLLLAIDLSSKPGFARYVDGKLVDYGTLFPKREYKDCGVYPLNFLAMTEEVVSDVICLLPRFDLDDLRTITVVLEETCGGHGYAIKKLEFLHCHLNFRLREMGIVPALVRDGAWKDLVGARQNVEEKKLNGRISRQKKKKKETFLKENPDAEKAPGFRAKLDLDGSGKAKVVRRLDSKDYSIRAVYEHFGIRLKHEENDASDAILLGYSFLHGVPIADGTEEGGLRSMGSARIPTGLGVYEPLE